MKKEVAEFIQTDDLQFVKKLAEKSFHVVEVTQFPDGRYAVGGMVIDLDEYLEDEDFCVKYLNPFGYESLEELRETYGDDGTYQIVAECISEIDNLQETGLCFLNFLGEVAIYLQEQYAIILPLE